MSRNLLRYPINVNEAQRVLVELLPVENDQVCGDIRALVIEKVSEFISLHSDLFNEFCKQKMTGINFEEFKQLMSEWTSAVRGLSSPEDIRKHPNYEKIISSENKDDIIGFACLCFEKCSTIEILTLLHELVPEEKRPPIDPYYLGKIPVIKECWKCWALKTGILSKKFNPKQYWVEDKYGNKGDWYS